MTNDVVVYILFLLCGGFAGAGISLLVSYSLLKRLINKLLETVNNYNDE